MAALGCAVSYQAAVHAQGGGALWTRIGGITKLEWGRTRDDFSEASVSVAKSDAGAECCGQLGDTRTWGHELTVYRDEALVWQGPIVRTTETRTGFTLEARDMIAWLDKRAVSPAAAEYFAPTPYDTGAQIRLILQDAFPAAVPLRDPGLTQWMDVSDTGTGTTIDHLWKDTKMVGDLVRELLAAGVDMYTVGRRVVVASDEAQLGLEPLRLRDQDFLADLHVVENGLDAATRGLLVGGQPLDGNQQPVEGGSPIVGRAGGPEPFYGQLDKISTSPNTTDQATADGIAAAMRAYGHPPPLDLVIPDNARLSPQAQVTIDQLMPGAVVIVTLDGYCRQVQGDFRLTELAVSWEPGTDTGDAERIAVSLAAGGPVRTVGQA